MKTRLLATTLLFLACLLPRPLSQAAETSLPILDEKVSRLIAQVEDLQFRFQQTQKDIEKLQTEMVEIRKAAGGVAAADLKALDDRITAIDADRKRDQKALIDQLSKELAGTSAKPATDANVYVVAKGDTLSSIAKTHKVTVDELKKANNLAGNDLKVGQKLTLPK